MYQRPLEEMSEAQQALLAQLPAEKQSKLRRIRYPKYFDRELKRAVRYLNHTPKPRKPSPVRVGS